MIERAAVVGCGVIGSGWVARLRLRGVDVSVFDPSPDAPEVLELVTGRARDAWAALGLPVDAIGRLDVCDSIGDAVEHAWLVHECVPERLDLKLATLDDIDSAAPPSALVASSTSGFTPSSLATGLEHRDRFVVAHPFNPVYLLPLVEVVAGTDTASSTVERATQVYEWMGMKPLHVRVEIDAFIADRLLEAVWREALWLVNDGVATTEEVDEAIRHGFGLRWAQMGLFETYRTAGGSGGMRHFLAQFGPALDWPWTKLTDTPEWTDELVETIASQSDQQSGDRTIAELIDERDRNLVAILSALEATGGGAGGVLASFRASLG